MSEITLNIGDPDSYHTITLHCLQHDGTCETTAIEIHVLPQDRPRMFEIRIEGGLIYSSRIGNLSSAAHSLLAQFNENWQAVEHGNQ